MLSGFQRKRNDNSKLLLMLFRDSTSLVPDAEAGLFQPSLSVKWQLPAGAFLLCITALPSPSGWGDVDTFFTIFWFSCIGKAACRELNRDQFLNTAFKHWFNLLFDGLVTVSPTKEVHLFKGCSVRNPFPSTPQWEGQDPCTDSSHNQQPCLLHQWCENGAIQQVKCSSLGMCQELLHRAGTSSCLRKDTEITAAPEQPGLLQ